MVWLKIVVEAKNSKCIVFLKKVPLGSSNAQLKNQLGHLLLNCWSMTGYVTFTPSDL